MTPEIQKNLEDRTAFEIIQELKTMFQQQAEQELFETVKAFHAFKQKECQSISTYVLKMKAYLDQMECLGYPMPLVLGLNLILTSLLKDYDQFVQNYNMHYIGKTIHELHAMLKLTEKELKKNKANTYGTSVDLPPNCKIVGSKWLFKKNTDIDGNIHTYKARLVAKSFTQTYGIDCEETFSHVANIKTIRILIAITAYYEYEIWKTDVKTAFLNDHLNEDIYMVQPEGFVNPKHPRRICKLQISIYELKQAFTSWNKRFDEEIKKYGFTQNPDEPCVYKRASGSEAAYVLGIKIYRDRSRRLISLSQNAYIYKILKRFKMDASKRGTIPMQPDVDLSKTHTGRGVVDWKSSKQSTTAMSSMKVEYIAAAETAMEAIWIRKFIYGLGVVPNNDRHMDMYCDNTGAITIANEPGV
uniref:Reverse transcriptase Ty1/copia-type domain-containing protein n=1 Tax=Tanacetum cinerariifolium TaxID=118510 RepID=A0A6L2NFD1_TANCI|nr:hypothetical protein [Tanacetum cinerariifolium]